MPNVLVVSLGATALQAFDPASGSMQLKLPPAALLETAARGLAGVAPRLVELPFRSGAELSWETIVRVRDLLLAELDGSSPPAGAVVLAGTDTLEELAFSLHLMLGAALRQRWRAPLVLTGAMLPADQLGTDNARNLKDALLVAVDASTPHCALLVMGETIHLAQHVRKADSQLLGAFASHPGPLGQLRGGRPVYYYAPPPPPPPLAAAPHGSEASDADDAFERVPAEALARQRVAIWTLTVGAFLPQALLAELHGLVLAGSGTGSVPAALVEQLAPERTARLPTVIVSRCAHGANCDDHLYRGSREKYEGRGFILGRGYEHLSPLQARALLCLRLAARGQA